MAMAASTMMRLSVTAESFHENHRPSMAVDAQIRSKITSTDGTVRLPFGSFGSNFFRSTAEFGQGSALQCQSARTLQPIRATATEAPPRVQRSSGKERTKIGINGFGRIGKLKD